MEEKIKIETHPNPECLTVHTNFVLSEHRGLKFIIESLPGVEEATFYSFHKYQFSVKVGVMFDKQEIMNAIQDKITDYLIL